MPSLTARRRAAELIRQQMRARMLRDQEPASPPIAMPPPAPEALPSDPADPLPGLVAVHDAAPPYDPPPAADVPASLSDPPPAAGSEPAADQPPATRPRRTRRRRADGTKRRMGNPPCRQRYQLRRRERWIDIVSGLFVDVQHDQDAARVFANGQRDMIRQGFFDKKTKQEVIDWLATEFRIVDNSQMAAE
jgi:hypothetical protein